nr:sigma factor [Heyndrickxia oleronia]
MDRQSYNELDQIYRRYAEGLYYYLLHLSGSPSLSEELVQETFYRATISLARFKHQEVKPWLYKIARNTYIDEWRRRKDGSGFLSLREKKWLAHMEPLK